MGGKGGKKREPRRRAADYLEDPLPSSAYDRTLTSAAVGDDEDSGADKQDAAPQVSKFLLYQQSVQKPKGDISYLEKFFLMYVGGRAPLHLQEDFCGTALLSTHWLQNDPRRTAVGVDLDREALDWCLENNLSRLSGDTRLFLFHGNVLRPSDAILVKKKFDTSIETLSLSDGGSADGSQPLTAPCSTSSGLSTEVTFRDAALTSRDIVCAFNYSCCCLHKRKELVAYFKHAFAALSRRGGIFVMDLYGGTSSEMKLKLQRKFPDFTYIWEQEDFDILTRETRISLHFKLAKKLVLRQAFSYHWRLWSLPEIKDCLEEAGFGSIHFWIREMPDTELSENAEEFNASNDVKYQESDRFIQQDAWNAYVVAVANA